MEVKWAIEKETWHPKEDEDLVRAFNELGIKFKWVTFEGIVGDPYRYFVPNDCVVFYGSLQLAAQIRNVDWYPGLYYTLKNYNCNKYYPIFGKNLLNSKYYFLPFGSIIALKDMIFSQRNEVFMRPNSGNKVFTGEVACWDNLIEKMNLFEIAGPIDPQELVLISDACRVIREWRFIVVDEKVVTGCLYRSDVLSDTDTNKHEDLYLNAMRAAELASKIYQPDTCFTIDLCQTSSEMNCDLSSYTPRVLEINAFSTSAMYDCDIKLAVEAVSGVAWKQHQEYFYGKDGEGRILSPRDV